MVFVVSSWSLSYFRIWANCILRCIILQTVQAMVLEIGRAGQLSPATSFVKRVVPLQSEHTCISAKKSQDNATSNDSQVIDTRPLCSICQGLYNAQPTKH